MKVKGNTIEYKGYKLNIRGEMGAFFCQTTSDGGYRINHLNLEQAIAWIDEQGVKSE